MARTAAQKCSREGERETDQENAHSRPFLFESTMVALLPTRPAVQGTFPNAGPGDVPPHRCGCRAQTDRSTRHLRGTRGVCTCLRGHWSPQRGNRRCTGATTSRDTGQRTPGAPNRDEELRRVRAPLHVWLDTVGRVSVYLARVVRSNTVARLGLFADQLV